jgi:ribosomal protein S12 methylthiotransferase
MQRSRERLLLFSFAPAGTHKEREMKYYLMTLGCPKNSVDSEGMAMLLGQAGYDGTDQAQDADVLIVNTCGFLAAAETESLDALRELAGAKRPGQTLVAAGCMAQRNGQRILQEVPGVDGLLGTRRWMDVVPFVRDLRGGSAQRGAGRYALLGEPEHPWEQAVPRPPVYAGSAYLKVSDGCNAPCAFCAIPTIKGKLRSRPAAAIVSEAVQLVADGAQELIVIGQDSTDYGRDRNQSDGLPELLRAILAATPDLSWLRVMYAYPGHVTRQLVELMATEPRLLHYLDIPLQHGHPEVLRRMRRPTNVPAQLELFAWMRALMPDVALRSTFIVGFPGETEAEFQGLLDYLSEIQFDKVGVFMYSPEPGTPGFDMPEQVPETVKQERYDRAMLHQQRISLMRNQMLVGRTLNVLAESHGRLAGKKGTITMARSYRDAPEVDGLVIVPGTHPVGEMISVRITGAMEYDLLAEKPRIAAPV